ncbi:putative FAD dependent oxidoreductase-domain-containing protein [Seiridium cardinale]|uniref:FAD dependent oxidoreductase-domain-containing protein n=1 Tax=Seiridium cardinale TaxID=138064 RepID=A0ABR2XZ03_9PEZI
MSTPQQLLAQYEGQIVPRSFNAGFVTLSYVVSFIGAASTLELINRRTSRNGLFNHLILLSASVTMGGIAIWCMHFIGNRAIDLGDSEAALQIVYSSGFTALSFFLPILVLLAAFLAVGTNNRVSWWRIVVGGALAGGAICGMHYLGNASIDNYICIYSTVNVVGAALIAVAASIVSLALFFVFRAAWTTSWWKRGLCAIVLAGAVSGMHWCASTGTQYRLVRLSSGAAQLSRNITVIVVICLSVGAALIMATTAIYTTHVMRRYADKAQHIVLAAAVFDQSGRILVNPDGLLPSERITDTYLEKTPSDHFSIAHPLFHWMFRASRNWSGMTSVIDSMTNHVAHLRKGHRDGKVRLIDDNGQLVQNYDVIFRELFCLAASNLADKTKERVSNVGILWDEILPTGASLTRRQRLQSSSDTQIVNDGRGPSPAPDADILAEKGEGWRAKQQEYSRGSLMFLVRRLGSSRDVEKLEAAGFRFAEVNQVSGIIGTSMQIKTRNLSSKLSNMATYGDTTTMMEPGVHLSFFGLRARVGGHGFDVLVRRGARNLLPSMQMPLDHLESWQMDFIRQLDRMNVPLLCQKLDAMKKLSPREMLFASQMYDTIEALRAWVDDPICDEAVLTSKVVQVPCRPPMGSASAATCTLVTLKMVIPIHVNLHSPKCEFVPLSFFKVHQLVYRDSPHHAAFSLSVHRDISPVVNAAPVTGPSSPGRKNSSFLHFKVPRRSKVATHPVDGDGNPIPTNLARRNSTGSTHSGSTIKLWNGSSNEMPTSDAMSDRITTQRTETPHPANFGLGGIMISQEIKVDVREANEASDVGRRYSLRQAGASPNSAQASGKSNADLVTIVSSGHKKAAMSKSEIEMKSMSEPGEDVHSGPTARSAMIESGRAGEAGTFVDELFAVCLDGR